MNVLDLEELNGSPGDKERFKETRVYSCGNTERRGMTEGRGGKHKSSQSSCLVKKPKKPKTQTNHTHHIHIYVHARVHGTYVYREKQMKKK